MPEEFARRRILVEYVLIAGVNDREEDALKLARLLSGLEVKVNVIPLNEIGALPTRNLQSGRFEGASAISGERLAEAYLGRRVACAHCPVACVHLWRRRVCAHVRPQRDARLSHRAGVSSRLPDRRAAQSPG
jgi:hypothetical protein